MIRLVKLVVCASVVTVTLSLFVSVASAGRLSISNQTIRAAWSAMGMTFGSTGFRCPVTLEGSFHARTFTKVLTTLLGMITRASINATPCAEAMSEVRWLTATLPWPIRYRGFGGTLPRITFVEVGVIGLAFLMRIGAKGCLYASTTARPAVFALRLTELGAVSSWVAEIFFPIPLSVDLGGFPPCAAESIIEGAGASEGLNQILLI